MIKLSMKFFIWIIEFKVKRKRNVDKLLYLITKLIKELELQGYNLGAASADDCKYFVVFEHQTAIAIKSNSDTEIRLEKQVKANE